jgi:hypothetical protein
MIGPPKKARSKNFNKIVTVRGIIIPAAWDEDGNVTALGLSSKDEKHYLLENAPNLEKLYECLQKEVEVCGVLKGEGDKSTIVPKGFRQIAGFSREPFLRAVGED